METQMNLNELIKLIDAGFKPEYLFFWGHQVPEDGSIGLSCFSASDSPKEMKALGRKVRNFDAAKWDEYKYQVVIKGNLHKFTQNENFRDFLLTTGNKVIVEASPRNCIWGIGLGKDNPAVVAPTLWRGQNLLGFALMEVRTQLLNNITLTKQIDAR